MKLVKLDTQEKLALVSENIINSQFLQSWAWGEFQISTGARIMRFGVEEGGELIAAATFIKKNIGLGKSYLYCPRGPLVNDKAQVSNFESVFDFLMSEIRKIAEKENIVFVRIEPLFKIQNSKFKIVDSIDIQPARTLMLDLRKTEEELMKQMHQKTRYNIRLAQKRGIKVREAGKDEFEHLWKLFNETKERDGFRLHSKEYYKRMIDLDNTAVLFAEFENKLLSANIISFYGDTATYVHGSSSNEKRNLMAPYALQWHTIKKSKDMGLKYYDFYGIDEKKWPGVTRFKNGFGGFEKKYPGTFDLVFNNLWYNIYSLLRWVRRKI